jgi:integral membrane sensor domain MASE1
MTPPLLNKFTKLFNRLRSDRSGSVASVVVAVVFIFVVFIIWVSTVSPTFYALDMLMEYVDLPIQASTVVRICRISSGLALLCGVIAFVIWAVASAFRREDQTFEMGVL